MATDVMADPSRLDDAGGSTDLAVPLGERRSRFVSVQTAWVRDRPQFDPLEVVRLASQRRLGSAECGSIRSHAGDGDHTRTVLRDDAPQVLAAGPKLVAREFTGTYGRSIHEVGDPDATSDQVRSIRVREPGGSIDLVLDEAGLPERRVEPVAGVGEVRLRRSRPQARVDADEEQQHPCADEIGHLCIPERLQFVSREAHRGSHPRRRSRMPLTKK